MQDGVTASERTIHSFSAPQPIGPYVQAVAQGPLIFCSGQIGIDPLSGELVSGGIRAEADQAIRNLETILQKGGGDLESITQANVFLTDLADYQVFNEVYGSFFFRSPPSRTAVQVSALPMGACVEISCIAMLTPK
ncbi:MAG: Rid family detoxifying hydrolase [Chlamydiia bacterium]|nr:Rid family detoxifying hydrolase [Chlamydiia bacterium]